MVHVVVECEYEAPFDKKAWYAADLRLLPCLEAHGAKWIRSQVSLDGRRTICEFEAPDAESVRTAYRKTDLAFQKVWISEVLDSSQDLAAWIEKPHSGISRIETFPSEVRTAE
ncbi:MAG: DUF4242 domain-containing protein [Leptolyngbyaceae cyanobacterium CSU_1_4]|nr:DUF4242 domain-containing protein [Leptolyngbyaceae cyanobacterium CSU_1_4]